jgi:hypothetical protein
VPKSKAEDTLKEAERIITKAVDSEPENGRHLHWRAEIRVKLGKTYEAHQDVNKSLELEEDEYYKERSNELLRKIYDAIE